MDVSLKHPFLMLVFGGRDVVKSKFTKKLLKSKLIAPPTRKYCLVLCKASTRLKMNERYENECGIYRRYSWRVGQVFQEEQKKSHYTG